jgi:hypothetical protein
MGFLSLIGGLPALISGMFGTINGITNAISNQKIAAINATTQEAKIAAEEQVQTLQARRDVLIAEAGSGSRINLWMRVSLAIGPCAVLLKVFLWDKVIGSLVGCSQAAAGTCGIFTTDPLDANLWQVITIVLGFYFVSEVTLGVTRIVKSK